MTEIRVLDANNYGFFSREWLLSAALEHAPKEYLEAAIRYQILYLTREENLSIPKQLDLLAQISLTGMYTPTAFPPEEDEESVEVTPDGQVHNEQNTGLPITDEEIERFGKMFDRLVDPDAGPDGGH